MGTSVGPDLHSQLDRVTRQLATEFAGLFSREAIARYVEESRPARGAADRPPPCAPAALSRGATVQRFIPIFVEGLARERLQALAQVDARLAMEVPEVLFVCVHNARRSQMAASLLNHHAQGRAHARSAGSLPADQLNPAVVTVMSELGLDLSEAFPKPLTDEVLRAADVVVTMGAAMRARFFPASSTSIGMSLIQWDNPSTASGLSETRSSGTS